MCFNFTWSVTLAMTSSGAFMVMWLIVKKNVFPLIYFNFNVYYTVDKFDLFLIGEILRGVQNIEKFIIFWKSMILQKECIAMFPRLTLIVIHWKIWILRKTAFPLAFKETGSACTIYWNLPYQPVCSLLHQWLDKINPWTWKPPRDDFFFFSCACVLFFSGVLLLTDCRTDHMTHSKPKWNAGLTNWPWPGEGSKLP